MTEACIVGWAHSPFGKLEDPDIEALIGRVAGAAIEDAGIAADRDRRARFVSLFNNGFSNAGLSRLAGAAARAGTALQADHPVRERLRVRLRRGAWRARLPRRRPRPVRAGDRRGEDDRHARARRSATSC